MLSDVGDVLGELGAEVQRIKDLEVAADVTDRVAAAGAGRLSDHKGNYVESKPPITPRPLLSVPVVTTVYNLTEDAEKT